MFADSGGVRWWFEFEYEFDIYYNYIIKHTEWNS